MLTFMKEEFQQLYDSLKNHPKSWKQGYNNKIMKLLLEKIGKDTFCSVMDMKYSEVTTSYGGSRFTDESGRFHNKFWEFNFILETPDHPLYFHSITLKNQGTYFSPDDKFKIMKEWLVYFKERCRVNGIEIKD